MPWPELFRRPRRLVDPIALRLAGRAGSLVVVEHVGRRSGTLRRAPVRAFRRADTVAVGANFGAQTDWVKNVRAAGGCRMTMRSHTLTLGNPHVVPFEDGAWVFPWWFAAGLRRLAHTEHVVLLRVVPDAAHGPQR